MNVLYRSELSPELLAMDLGTSLLLVILTLVMRKEKKATASKQTLPAAGTPGAWFSWDSCSETISAAWQLCWGRLTLSPSPAATVQPMTVPRGPVSQGRGQAAPTSDPNLSASLSGLNCQVPGRLSSYGRAADSNVVLFTT